MAIMLAKMKNWGYNNFSIQSIGRCSYERIIKSGFGGQSLHNFSG